KDKTFYFGSYEGRRVRRGISSDVVTVPTSAERMGDFSASDSFSGVVADQFTADVLSRRLFGAAGRIDAGTAYSDIFRNNIIPLAAFDSAAFNLMNRFVPIGDGNGLLQTTPSGRERGDQFSTRIDHKISSRQDFSFYLFFNDREIMQPFARFQAGGANVPGFGT